MSTPAVKPLSPPGPAWVERVAQLCEARGLQLTRLRRDLVEILAAEPSAIGAYTLIERLAARQGKGVAPTTIYRTLDFLVEAGFVVKIESRQAYVACDHPGHHHHGALLICSNCGVSDEIDTPEIEEGVRAAAASRGFVPKRQVVEVEGLCAACQDVDGEQTR